jgi:hypothetical protein
MRSTESAIWPADCFLRDLDVAHHHHVLHTRQAFARGVGVERRHRPVVARVHGGQEVETFLATDFAQDDPVWPHTQRVDDEVADGDRALALEVGRAGFERQPVRLLKPKLGRVLDGDDALARVDHLRQGVEHGRLARAGAARDDDVHPRRARDLEHGRHLFRHGAEAPASCRA